MTAYIYICLLRLEPLCKPVSVVPAGGEGWGSVLEKTQYQLDLLVPRVSCVQIALVSPELDGYFNLLTPGRSRPRSHTTQSELCLEGQEAEIVLNCELKRR